MFSIGVSSNLLRAYRLSTVGKLSPLCHLYTATGESKPMNKLMSSTLRCFCILSARILAPVAFKSSDGYCI